ncbi:MAG: hypothetical protein EA422_12685 [Gemmatimonadales bacterium]|nr:MAG: hypothetical protein EA422_12685 [Gemmatimonadales bacterium]
MLPAVAGLGALLLLSGCLDDPAPPFEITGEGSVDGVAYFDAERTGVFDPSGGDALLDGIRVEIRDRGTPRAFPGSQVETGPDGRFLVEGLPPGTHHVWVDETSLPEGVLLCQNPRSVSVYRLQAAAMEIIGEPVCLISIQEAKDAGVGAFVNIQGIVTATPGDIRSDYTYVQDGSTGIRVFGSLGSVGSELQRGDRVTLTGEIGIFNNDLQLTAPGVDEVEPGVGEIAPRAVTTSTIAEVGAENRDPLQGSLVVVRRAQLVDGFDGRNAPIDDGSGATEVRIETAISGGGDETIRENLGLQVGACYDITGVIGNFRGTGQLFPRDGADFVEVACND